MADRDALPEGDVEKEFLALLEGLRVTLPGVQLITAFLLTVPLYDRYPDLESGERVAYYVAFGCALASSILLTAPSSHQRLRAHGGRVARHSAHHQEVAVRLTIAGSVLFGVALTAVAYVVSSLILSTPAAVAVTATMALVLAWSWFYLPLVTFRKR